ncbi:MAG: hypothetical protein KDH96_13655, partial [Candidatus Riesia sp.]|nr:hypothetical protein [Candidatus Riesia sp.]
DSVRFIITCNYPNYLIPELQSRFKKYHFNDMPQEDMVVRICDILDQENIEPNFNVIDDCVTKSYPDFRQILINLQSCVIDNKLVKQNVSTSQIWKEKVLTLLKTKQWYELFDVVRTEIPDNEINDYYELMYNNIHYIYDYDSKEFPQAVCIVAESLFKANNNSLPYIPMSSMVFELMSLVGAK